MQPDQPAPIMLTSDEVAQITGYRQPSRQLAALLSLGYWRARQTAAGLVTMERAHYEAVCRGLTGEQPKRQPKVRAA